MIEKLKSAINPKQNSAPIQYEKTKDIQQIYPYEEKISRKDLPRREMNGLTFTQNVGVFPRQVSLEIRHAHPTLGLNEVAHQRQNHTVYPNGPIQCQIEQKGVLSLGLPPNFMPKGFATVKSATSEAIHHYYETLNPKYANVMTLQQHQRIKV